MWDQVAGESKIKQEVKTLGDQFIQAVQREDSASLGDGIDLKSVSELSSQTSWDSDLSTGLIQS